MNKVLCFGELLMRLSPVLNREWIRQAAFPVYIGGAELNAAQALARWGVPVSYFTALPPNYLSQEILDELRSKNIDVSRVNFSGSRIGAYFLPQGADLKNAGVIYDRAHSSFAELLPGTIDWSDVLKDISWLHFSAICPALTESSAIVCKEILQAASGREIVISVDLNYRAKLWQYGKRPVEVMPDLLSYCHVVMGNLWAVETMLGIPSLVATSAGKRKDELVDAAKESMLQIHKRYPQVTSIGYTFRLENSYFGVFQQGTTTVFSKTFALGNIIDKVGSGDCFMAGLIYGLYKRNGAQDIIDFATAAAVGKLYEVGDATQRSAEEVRIQMVENTNAE